MLTTIIALLGAALIVVLVYLVINQKPIPEALKIVVLVALAIMILLCIMHTAGCVIGDGDLGRPGTPEIRP